jgi:4'-phosphopantetheinyl transferase
MGSLSIMGATRSPGARGGEGEGTLRSVWIAPTAQLRDVASSWRGVLSCEERQRYEALSAGADPDTWLVAHVAMRVVLARLLDVEPARLQFTTTPHPLGARGAKPWCIDAPWLDISMSHTASLSCIAIATDGLVGIDVEAMPTVGESTKMVLRNTTPLERRQLARLSPMARKAAFMELWCRKEACAKAVGIGLAAPFDRFTVDERGPHPRWPLDATGRSWSCHGLEVGAGYVATAAFTPAGTAAPRVVHLDDLD